MKHALIPILAALLVVSSSSQAQVTGDHLDRTTAALGAASASAISSAKPNRRAATPAVWGTL